MCDSCSQRKQLRWAVDEKYILQRQKGPGQNLVTAHKTARGATAVLHSEGMIAYRKKSRRSQGSKDEDTAG